MNDIIDRYIDKLPSSDNPTVTIDRPTGETLEETLVVYNQILSDLERNIELIKLDIENIKNKLNM